MELDFLSTRVDKMTSKEMLSYYMKNHPRVISNKYSEAKILKNLTEADVKHKFHVVQSKVEPDFLEQIPNDSRFVLVTTKFLEVKNLRREKIMILL